MKRNYLFSLVIIILAAGIIYIFSDRPDYVVIPSVNAIRKEVIKNKFDLSKSSKLEIDKDHNFYILDSDNHKLLKLNENGTLKKEIGVIGQGPGELLYPLNFLLYHEDEIYVLETGNSRIQIFDLEGNSKKIIKSNLLKGFPARFSVDSKKNIYINKPGYGYLFFVLDTNGNIIRRFGKIISKKTTENDADFVIDENDFLYVSFHAKGILRKYDSNGMILCEKKLNCKEIVESKKRIKKLPERPGIYLLTKYLILWNENLYLQVVNKERPLMEINLDGDMVRLIYLTDKKGIRLSSNLRSSFTIKENVLFSFYESTEEIISYNFIFK